MRNLFDQYDQPENKLTHALVCTLQSDTKLIRPFLRKLGILGTLPKEIQVVGQQVPGEAETGDEFEPKGLPDACFYANDGWAVLVESKVQAGISLNQLERHTKTAVSYGFKQPQIVLIAVDQPRKLLPKHVHSIEWRKVYEWFNRQTHRSKEARMFVDYMRVFEAQMNSKKYDIRGTITVFDGLRFDKEPYTYQRGKIVIRLFRSELQKRKDLHKLGVDPEGEGRTAITGSGQESVWDVLSLRAARHSKFTDYPHLTIDLHREYASAAISVPHGVKGGFRTKLEQSGIEGFRALIARIEKQLSPIIEQTEAQPMINVHQRHFPYRRSPEVTDARLIADLRTLVSQSGSKVKSQPEWLDAIYEVLSHKRSNLHFGVEVRFPYNCERIASREAVDLYVKAWTAMSPLLDFVLGRKQGS